MSAAQGDPHTSATYVCCFIPGWADSAPLIVPSPWIRTSSLVFCANPITAGACQSAVRVLEFSSS